MWVKLRDTKPYFLGWHLGIFFPHLQAATLKVVLEKDNAELYEPLEWKTCAIWRTRSMRKIMNGCCRVSLCMLKLSRAYREEWVASFILLPLPSNTSGWVSFLRVITNTDCPFLTLFFCRGSSVISRSTLHLGWTRCPWQTSTVTISEDICQATLLLIVSYFYSILSLSSPFLRQRS